MVHRREVAGEELVFGNQGDLWQNAMTWFDHSTGSVWSQPLGEAIMGPRAGQRLELLPSAIARWADWQERFPDTLALDAFTNNFRFSMAQMAVVASVGEDSLAVPIDELRDRGSVSVEVGGEPIIIVLDTDIDRWAAYSRVHGDRVLDLTHDGGVLVDRATGDRWDAEFASSLDGGEPLERVSVFSSFPEDYVRIFPEGRVFVGGELRPASDFADRCTSNTVTPTGCP